MTAPRLAQGKSGRHYQWPPNAEEPELVVPSITNILRELAKPALTGWAAKTVAEYAVTNQDAWANLPAKDAISLLKGSPYRHTRERADIGTAVHAAIETHINGAGEVDDTELLPYVAAGLQFLEDFAVKPSHVEATVFNETLQYAGTGDLFADTRDGVAVIDWKTKTQGQRLYPETALQLAALAAGEWIGTVAGDQYDVPECSVGYAVALYDDATYQAWTVDLEAHGPRLLKTFTALRTLHHWSQSVAPTVLDGPHKGSADSKAATDAA